ncbi:MAG TPA: GHKL domain-containing protein [Syntrophomonadaceae bacterium]|nr:GHKL domain-containing protein [Syntrophomonadaceae bacterium]
MVPGFFVRKPFSFFSIAIQVLCMFFLGICIFLRIITKPAGSFAVLLDIFTGGAFALLAIFMAHSLVRAAKAEAEAEINRIRMQETAAMIDMLRAQRHDFLNHLQVIYGLIQIGRTEVIKEYINQVNQEVRESSRLITSLIQRPEIAGLIMRKMAEAEADGIKFTVNLKTDLALLGVPPLDFSRILGNLIDNAINAVNTVPLEERIIKLEMAEDHDCYEIRVTNYRPLIPEPHMESVFEKGFTTKEDRGEGLGLFIVKTLVEKHRGEVRLRCSIESGTTFELRFPKAVLRGVV